MSHSVMEPKELKSDDVSFRLDQDQPIEALAFHDGLNVLLVKSSDQSVKVVDPVVGEVIYSAVLGAGDEKIDLNVVGDKVVVLRGNTAGIRSEYKGVILLDTILQTVIEDQNEKVQLELNVAEAENLLHSLRAVGGSMSAGEGDIANIEQELKNVVVKANEIGGKVSSVKKEKWSTVKLELPYNVLKSTFQTMVTELWKRNAYIPQLSTAASILERLNVLMPSAITADATLDKAQMFSESTRLGTFSAWPHTSYRWALPEKMAQAGFYHHPSNRGEDRALCFACNVTLVSWEPTDEPWSEHERHSPFCPFVRGEHTHNVPLHITEAAIPAIQGRTENGKLLYGKSSCSDMIVLVESNGDLIVYDVQTLVKETARLSVDELLDGNLVKNSGYCDINLKPKGAEVMHVDADSVGKYVVTSAAITSSPDRSEKSRRAIIGIRKDSCGSSVSILLVATLHLPEKGANAETSQVIKTPGSTGTRQENDDMDDLEDSFLSAADLMSDVLDASYDTSKVVVPKPAVVVEKLASKGPGLVLLNASTIVIPSELQSGRQITDIIPSSDGSVAVVVLNPVTGREAVGSIILSLKMWPKIPVEQDLVIRKFETTHVVSSCIVPPDVENYGLACVFGDGSVKILELLTLKTTCEIPAPAIGISFTSVTFCPSLERLCCGRNDGLIELFSVGGSDLSSGSCTPTDQTKSIMTRSAKRRSEKVSNVPVPDMSSENLMINQPLSETTVAKMLELTEFDHLHSPFSANLPSCWVKIDQAQKERKNPQHLQHFYPEHSPTTASYRLQRNKLSRKEHLLEITLPYSTYVGHVDFKFMLQPGCSSLPPIEVTLYRASKFKPKVDPEDKSQKSTPKSKYQATEFLQSINAEIICGPLDLSYFLDLSGESGNVVMTSPALMLHKGTRNLYLHVKAKQLGKSESTAKSQPQPSTSKVAKPKTETSKTTKPSVPKQGFTFVSKSLNMDPMYYGYKQYLAGHPVHKPLLDPSGVPITDIPDKKKDYGGCDWLHEISITIRPLRTTSIPLEVAERRGLLMSQEFLHKLVNAAAADGESAKSLQNNALDLLAWIASINLCGPPVGEAGYQSRFLQVILKHLKELVLNGIISASRSTSHKTARVLILCIESAEKHGKIEDWFEDGSRFRLAMLETLLELLPATASADSAGGVQWYFLLVNRVRAVNPKLASECLLDLLRNVSEEMKTRIHPLHAVLRTKFGLYGTPFDSELFDIETPAMMKSVPTPVSYSGMCHHHENIASSALVAQSTSKDIDLRDLLNVGSSSSKSTKGFAGPMKQQVHGLLEIEPLHFTFHAASDGTRLEKIDNVATMSSFTTVLPPSWESSSTNLPTGEGSKKAETHDKMEQILMLHKALKMDSYDPLHDSMWGLGPPIKIMTDDAKYKSFGVPKMIMDPTTGYISPSASKMEFHYVPSTTSSSSVVPSISTTIKMSPFSVGGSKAFSASALKPSAPLPPPPKSKENVPMPGSSRGSEETDKLKRVYTPWQQMMCAPAQQAIVVDRLHSGARRYVVIDFGTPIVLTDIIIPSCSNLVSLSVDIWIHREEVDGQRLVVASDIRTKSLILSDLQPAPICRYLKITVIGWYGMGPTKCRIPVGMFYGHTVILPNDTSRLKDVPASVSVVTVPQVQSHLAVLNSLVEDIGCRYRIACDKLKRLLEPLLKLDITSLDPASYYSQKSKDKFKIGNSSASDDAITHAYQECTMLQEQLNVARNVVKRLERLTVVPRSGVGVLEDVRSKLKKLCTDKLRILSDRMVESLLGISILSPSSGIRGSMIDNISSDYCENLFKNLCILEQSYCQLSVCTVLLRLGGSQPWWGSFLARVLQDLFSSGIDRTFPQDRVFILLAYLGQKALTSARNSSVVEAAVELIKNTLLPLSEDQGFLSSMIDMKLLGWSIMFLCLCLDGLYASSSGSKKSSSKARGKAITSRWDFIQGESALYKVTGAQKSSSGLGMTKKRIQKKLMATKQKLQELDNVAAGLAYPSGSQPSTSAGLGSQLSALGNKLEALKQKTSNLGVGVKLHSSKHFKDLLQMKRSEYFQRKGLSAGSSKEDPVHEQSIIELPMDMNVDRDLSLSVARSLGMLLLGMDSTCHSDMYLIVCKALARIATTCKPGLRLGSIFNPEQLVRLILTSVGDDYVRQQNWANTWISHAIMCLLQDLLETERLRSTTIPESMIVESPVQETKEPEPTSTSSQKTESDDSQGVMLVDEAESVQDAVDLGYIEDMEMFHSDDGDLDYDDFCNDVWLTSMDKPPPQLARRSSSKSKKRSVGSHSISSALDARLEAGVESTAELRLRLLSVQNTEILSEGIKAPLNITESKSSSTESSRSESIETSENSFGDSCELLQQCFERVFDMMTETCSSVSIAKVLQLWISLNTGGIGQRVGVENTTLVPVVPLSANCISALLMALTKNTSIGVQEWGLSFHCLTLLLNQRSTFPEGDWLVVLQSQYFPEVVLRFITGSGMNMQKSHLPSVGPTVCQQFYNFLTRLRELCHDSPWTSCLKEILLRVLRTFLSGPFLETDFPMDAFNKFLDRIMCPDLSYENASTVCTILEAFAQVLHTYVFYPKKITVHSLSESRMTPNDPCRLMKTMASLTTSTETRGAQKNHDFEQIIFRLTSFAASCVALPFKNSSSLEIQKCLDSIGFTPKFTAIPKDFCEEKMHTDENQKTIADMILRMEKSMMRILSVLANPNGITVLASGDLATAFNILDNSTPTNVVDAVIHLFSKICNHSSNPSWTIKPLLRFLSKSPYDDFYCPLIVSETFVLLVLKVISKEEHLREFMGLNCVEAICKKLIESTQMFFSSCPTFVSFLTQYIGRNEKGILNEKKYVNDSLDVAEGLINVAPLGTITSSSFANSPDVLLHATAPHRRARAPLWSYHFLPDETYLELTITLPCAILLKEVHVLPHAASSVSTCPSAVMVEISRDRSPCTLPMGRPLSCSGLSSIVVQLTAPEVAQTILLRLYKPKDCNNLGLSQIKVLGCTTFSEAAVEGSVSENARNLEASAQWMYILDRALTTSKESKDVELHQSITKTAISMPNMLGCCYSMLVAPVPSSRIQKVYIPHVASVLFQFGHFQANVSKDIMRALLGPVQRGFASGMVTNISTQFIGSQAQLATTVELLYKLCCEIPSWGKESLTILISWLDEASTPMQNQFGFDATKKRVVVPEYVQAIAAILWSFHEKGKLDLTDICTPEFTMKIFKWTETLLPASELKAALDHVLCSLCSIKPWLLVKIMWELGMLKYAEWANPSDSVEESLHEWYEEGSIWGHLQCKEYYEIKMLNQKSLVTLARAALSPVCCQTIQNSDLLLKLNDALMNFWSVHNRRWRGSFDSLDPQEIERIVDPETVVSILKFYHELCQVHYFKSWFGKQGSAFWFPLLDMLSSMPENVKSESFGSAVYDIESTIIDFLSRCCWSHPDNQSVLTTCLCEIIAKQKELTHKALYLHSMSSFCRRLLLKLLLENEKTVIHVKNKTKYHFKYPQTTVPIQDRHPSMEVNEGDRILISSTHSTMLDVLKSIEPMGVSLENTNAASNDNSKLVSLLKKEQGIIEAGLEMIDQMQLSMTGAAAKEKRSNSGDKRLIKSATKKLKPETSAESGGPNKNDSPKVAWYLEIEEFPGLRIPSKLTVSTVMSAVKGQRTDAFLDYLTLTVKAERMTAVNRGQNTSAGSSAADPEGQQQMEVETNVVIERAVPEVFNVMPLPSTIEIFSRSGGFRLLAKHLPVVYPDTLRSMSSQHPKVKLGSSSSSYAGLKSFVGPSMYSEFPKSFEEAYDDIVKISEEDLLMPPSMKKPAVAQFKPSPGVPPHSMAAFGLFLSLPRFPEVLLSDRLGAQCMLRLVMGVTDDAEGNDIFGSAIAKSLPILPFQVLKNLLDVFSEDSEEGQSLRKAMIEVKAVHFILACLAVFTHQNCDSLLAPGAQHELVIAATKAQGGYQAKRGGLSDDKSHVYWAKGTGFGTGSTTQSWDVEQALQKQKHEEEQVTSLVNVLSSFVSSSASQEESGKGDPAAVAKECLPEELRELLKTSCLFPAISGYLRNDSVLDMARHVPLYRSVLLLLRALALSPQLAPLLVPSETKVTSTSDDQPIPHLLSKMKEVVDHYSSRLMSNRSKGQKGKPVKASLEDLEDEGLAKLIPDIQNTAVLVQDTMRKLAADSGNDVDMQDETAKQSSLAALSMEDRYTAEMKKIQFGFHDMITEDEDSGGIRFTVNHHYEGNLKQNWTRSAPARLKRLAQESVTLSTSLPLAYGSTIFVRCDTDRFDIMKVLITGPAGTPYANGCFEFDVFFPSDYPNSPLQINLETTGRQRVRFNPNLYNDGKVCLSILNTWHGRPEEKWNPQTSSLLPVLVAIQSLILNAEPYFNEPGYEKSRGTENGEKNSREYNAGIEIATLEWAMLDQLRHPSPCFKDVVQRHFFMKRGEVIAQCEKWLEELVETCKSDKRVGKHLGGTSDPVGVFRNHLTQLKKELLCMKPPLGLEDIQDAQPGPSARLAEPGNTSTSQSSSGPSDKPGSAGDASTAQKPGSSKVEAVTKKSDDKGGHMLSDLLQSSSDMLQMSKLLVYHTDMDTEDVDFVDAVFGDGSDLDPVHELEDEDDDDICESMDFA